MASGSLTAFAVLSVLLLTSSRAVGQELSPDPVVGALGATEDTHYKNVSGVLRAIVGSTVTYTVTYNHTSSTNSTGPVTTMGTRGGNATLVTGGTECTSAAAMAEYEVLGPCKVTTTVLSSDVASGIAAFNVTATVDGGTTLLATVLTAVVPVYQAPAVTVAPALGSSVTVSGTPQATVGSNVTYAVTFTNGDFNTTDPVAIGTTKSGAVVPSTCTSTGVVLARATLSCNITYQVTAADETADTIAAFAITAASSTNSSDVLATVNTAAVLVYKRDTLTVTSALGTTAGTDYVTVGANNETVVGSNVTYSVTFTSGDLATATSFAIATTKDGAVVPTECASAAAIAANTPHTCSITYVVTAADETAGTIAAFAITASANGTQLATVNTAAVPVYQRPAVAVTQTLGSVANTDYVTVSGVNKAKVGSNVTYAVTFTNGDLATTTPVAIISPTGTVPAACTSSAVVAAAGTLSCSITYQVTAADEANGTIAAFAITAASSTNSSNVLATVNTAAVPVYKAPAATVAVTLADSVDANGTSKARVGSNVTYAVTFTNGDLNTSAPVVIAATKSGAVVPSACTSAGNVTAGATHTCAITYTVMATEETAGVAAFPITATSASTQLATVTTAVVPVFKAPTVTVTQALGTNASTDYVTVNGVQRAKVGSTITYTVTLTSREASTGNVSITAAGATPGANCTSAAPLAAGSSMTCQLAYTVVSGDVTAAQVAVRTVTVTDANTTTVLATAQTAVVPVYTGLRSFTATRDVTSAASTYVTIDGVKLAKAGGVVTYTFTFINGQTAVSTNDSIAFVTTLASPTTLTTCTPAKPAAGLAADTTLVCTLARTVTAADITQGTLPAFNVTAQTTPVANASDTPTVLETVAVSAVSLYTEAVVAFVSQSVTSAAGTYVEVNGVKLPKVDASAIITYLFTFTNGATPVENGTTLSLPVTGTGTGQQITTCTDANSLAVTLPLTTGLAGNARLTCSYPLNVTSGANGVVTGVTGSTVPVGSVVKSFNVTATTTSPTNAAYSPTLVVAAVPVHVSSPIIQASSATITTDTALYQRVESKDLAKEGGSVKYTIALINSASLVNSTTTSLYFETTFVPQPTLACALNTAGTGFAVPTTADVPANTALVCTFTHVVTAADVAATELPAFTVTAKTNTSGTLATYVAATTVPAVRVFTVPTLAVTYALPAGSLTRIASGANLTNVGTVITYTVTLRNGAVALPNTYTVAISTTKPTHLSLTDCTVDGSSATLPLSTGLVGYAIVQCVFTHTVTAADVAVGNITSFTVSATKSMNGTSTAMGSTQYQSAIMLFSDVPCTQCRGCLADMQSFISGILADTNPLLIAGQFDTKCAETHRNTDLCKAVINAILNSTDGVGNTAKRAGKICQMLQECEPSKFAASGCSLETATPYVPAGPLDLCTTTGTNSTGVTIKVIPGVVAAGTNLTAGQCRTTPDCANPTDQMCDTSSPVGQQCVCNAATGIDSCSPYYSCVDNECTRCRTCFITMRAFTTQSAIKSSTNATYVAMAFREKCISMGGPLEFCSVMALEIDASYSGNLGKRPGWLCNRMSMCNTTSLAADCIVSPNTTVGFPYLVQPADISLCNNDGYSNGTAVPGVGAALNTTCPTTACNATEGYLCNYAAGNKACECDATTGVDTCADAGVCVQKNCAKCNTCVLATHAWIKSRLSVTDAAAIGSDWMSHCGNTLKVTDALCAEVQADIANSFQGNIGKRATNLCSRINHCVLPDASCKVNTTKITNASVAITNAALDLCTVEGVTNAAATNPDVPTSLPNKTLYCNSADSTCAGNTDMMCDFTTVAGAYCNCDGTLGNVDCVKYNPCIPTPCKVCSDCLAEMTTFTLTQQYTLAKVDLADAFTAYCTGTKTWTADKCAAVATTIKATGTTLEYGKRAARLCQGLGVCVESALGAGCTLVPTATVNATALDLCTVEGVASGDAADVPGFKRLPDTGSVSLPEGMCGNDDDCGDADKFCNRAFPVDMCSCLQGNDTCRNLGKCEYKPCKQCNLCLSAFQTFVSTTADTYTSASGLGAAAAFPAACEALNRSSEACKSAGLAISNSFMGNLGRRAGSICELLGECNTTAMGECTLLDAGGLDGNFSRCTVEGVDAATAAAVTVATTPPTAFPLVNITMLAGDCKADADCTTAGQFCSFETTTTACACIPATGRDTCTTLGTCTSTPCSQCQTCLSDAQPEIALEVNKTVPVYTAGCDGLVPTTATAENCTAINSKYVSAAGASGLFGLRAGALCSVLQECSTALPATCSLQATIASVNKTGALDLCTAEGIVGGTTLSTPPTGSCLTDVDCGTGKQCDLRNFTTVWRCSGGLDTGIKYGTCVDKPVLDTTISPCTRCGSCLTAVRAGVEVAALNKSLSATQLGDLFYTTCSTKGFGLAACRAVQTAITSSYKGNLARRAGALCMRLGECAASLTADATCVLSSNATDAIVVDADSVSVPVAPAVVATSNVTTSVSDNSTLTNSTAVDNSTSTDANTTDTIVSSPAPAEDVVSGKLDACTVEGVNTGMRVDGTYKFGAVVNNSCVLDSDCAAGTFCSSATTITVCRCLNGIDSCDVLSTCKAPVTVAPPPQLTPCERCQLCLTGVQSFVTANLAINNSQPLAASFMTPCLTNFTGNNFLVCKQVSDAIAYSKAGVLARRAGALCSRLGNCTADLEGATSTCNMTAGAKSGRLNQCITEGVGVSPAKAVDNTTCRVDTDCKINGTYDGTRVCSMAPANITLDCTCDKGVDSCVPLGKCDSFCSTKDAYITAFTTEMNKYRCNGPYDTTSCGAGMQCTASTQCKQLTCDNVKGIVATPCYGVCMMAERKVLSASMGSDGKIITAALNTPAATNRFPCASLFDASTSALLGSDALCSVGAQGAQVLVIELGPSATIMPGVDSLTVAAGQTMLHDILLASAKFSGTAIPVAMCDDCAAPTAKLIGPKVVADPCDATTAADIIFDATFSTDSSGRRLSKVRWAHVPSGTEDVVLAAAIDKANAANDGKGAYRIIIPAAELVNMKEPSYTITVTVTSYLMKTNTATLTFDKVSSGATPVISIVNSGTIPFKIADGVKVAVQLMAASVCTGSQVQYLWEPTTAWAAVPAGYNLKDLVIPGPVPGVTGGQTKSVRVSAWFVGKQAQNTTVEVTLKAESSEIVAHLKGPSGDIPKTRTVVLDAAGSFDPDDPQRSTPLTVGWTCVRADYPEPCFTGINNYGTQEGMNWTLPLSLLAADIEHTFTVTVARSSGGTSVPASVTFKPSTVDVPTGRIRRICSGGLCPPRHNADNALALIMALDAGSSGATVTWKSDQMAQLSPVSGPDFVIPAADLPKSGAVTVVATVSSSVGTSTTKLTVPINAKPACASSCIQVTPATGVFPTASFTAEAAGFLDDQPGLRYDFGVKGAYESRVVVSSGPAPTFTFTGLPIGDNWLYVCAVDVDGAQACSEAKVTVTAPAADSDFKVADAISAFDVAQLSGAGDVSVLASGAQALQSLSKYAATSGVAASQTAEEKAQVANAIAAKTGSMINTLAGSADAYINDPQTMSQVVSAVATLSKTSASLSKDSKAKMLSVANSGIASAKLRKKPLSPAEASRLWSVVGAGNSMKDVCKVPGAACAAAAAATNARRLLQEVPDWFDALIDGKARVLLEQQQQEIEQIEAIHPVTPVPKAAAPVYYSRHMPEVNTTSSNDTESNTTSNTTETAPPPAAEAPPAAPVDAPPAPPAPFEAPFAGATNTIADLLAAAATPATGALGGGDNGLFVSVANLLGRNYSPSKPVVVGPAISGTGEAADPASGENARVAFSAALKGVCVDEDGVTLAAATCSDVVVPMRVTYLPDATSLLQPPPETPATSARKLAALPADWTVVSGAVTVDVAGSDPATGALPCTGCTATVTIPIWEEKEANMLYQCSRIVEGANTVDAADATSLGVVASDTTPAVPSVQCAVNKAGSYLVGKTMDPERPQGTTPPDYTAYEGNVKPGEPVRVTLKFVTVDTFDHAAFLADAAKVEAFTTRVKAELAASLSAISNAITDTDITIDNLRQGSLVVDVTVLTTDITDASVMTQLVGSLVADPKSLFSAGFWTEYTGILTGEVTGELTPAVTVPQPMNIAAIVGGVVGGVGGAILIAVIAFFVMKRRRMGGVEPRGNRGGLLAEGEAGV